MTSIGWSTSSSTPRKRAWKIGFQFVDIKHCHGYFGHELLSGATVRAGTAAASRTARAFMFARRRRHPRRRARAAARRPAFGDRHRAVQEVRRMVPAMPEVAADGYRHGFGVIDDSSLDAALEDSRALLRLMRARELRWICVTAGSPYHCPHVVRPALFPPIDGYEPPEDPLRGVARQIARDGAAEGGVSGHGLRRLGLHLSAGMAAARRPVQARAAR